MRAKYTSSIRHMGNPDITPHRETLSMARQLSCWLILLFTFTYGSMSDACSQTRKTQKTEEDNRPLPMKARWAFRTNAIDWLLLIPNAAVEFDLSASPYNKLTLNLGGKWNWNTSQTYKPSWVYNLWDVRPEIRYYWRTKQRNWKRSENEKIKFSTWLKEDVFSKEKAKARTWRAYYVGVYINAGGYSLKLSKRGIQGTTYGAGLSVGFGMPLYGYKNHAIDLELGGSIGVAYTRYDMFAYDYLSDCYPLIPEQSKKGHITPFPVVTDLRVSFVYRFVSVKEKYKKTDQHKIDARDKRAAERKEKAIAEKNRRDSIDTEKRSQKELEHKNDSIRKATEKAETILKKRNKQITDSLNRVEKDSTMLTKKNNNKKQDNINNTKPATDSLQQDRPLQTGNTTIANTSTEKKTRKDKQKKESPKAKKKDRPESNAEDATRPETVHPAQEEKSETGKNK